MMRNSLCLLVLAVVTWQASCRRSDPPQAARVPAEPPPTVGDGRAAASDAGVAEAVEAPLPPGVEEALRDVRDKRKCNRVMGCPPVEALLRAGVVSVAPMVELLRQSRGDAYWRPVLVRALGTIGHRGALPLLREQLTDPLWLIRTEAAIALGRMRDAESIDTLRSLLARADGEDKVAERAALGYALERLGVEGGRGALAEVLTPEAVSRNNWGYTAIAVELAAELGIRETLPGIRAAAKHPDVFLRKAAFAALGALRDGEAARLLVDGLDDSIPSARSVARGALEALTGEERTEEEWRRWCTNGGCEGPGRDAAP